MITNPHRFGNSLNTSNISWIISMDKIRVRRKLLHSLSSFASKVIGNELGENAVNRKVRDINLTIYGTVVGP